MKLNSPHFKTMAHYLKNHATMISLVFTVVFLTLYDLYSSHSLIGPDRPIHDPAVYRNWDSAYKQNDWYTNFVSSTDIHYFYGHLVNLYHYLSITEEGWRIILYIISLLILYTSIVKIVQLFNLKLLPVFLLVILHKLVLIPLSPPVYGLFLNWYDGLAPRSIGIPLSFLALYFFLNRRRIFCFATLGIATLIHVSNSLIVFLLFFLVVIIQEFNFKTYKKPEFWITTKRLMLYAITYLTTGGFFAIYIALKQIFEVAPLESEKFIWIWFNFRHYYMDITSVNPEFIIVSIIHILVVFFTGKYLYRQLTNNKNNYIASLLKVFMITVLFYGIFLLGVFTFKSLTVFKFYSFRIIYLAYFVCYLFVSLTISLNWKRFRAFIPSTFELKKGVLYGIISIIFIFSILFSLTFQDLAIIKLRSFSSSSSLVAVKILDKFIINNDNKYESALVRYLNQNDLLVLTPPGPPYLSLDFIPKIVNFKTLGFTNKGLYEWYTRINDVTSNKIELIYQHQTLTGNYKPILDAQMKLNQFYRELEESEIKAISQKYGVELFLAFKEMSFDFPILFRDSNYILYDLRSN